jgi:hypothetical protein
MVDKITYKGGWQVPGSEHWFSGTLTFDPENGSELEIVGSFQSMFDRKPIPLLWGRTSDGWVTLVDTRRSHGQASNVTRMEVSVYKSAFIFVGKAFESTAILFDAVKVSFFNLLEWLDPKGIEEDWSHPNYKLSYNQPAPVEFRCYEGCRGSIEFSLGGRYGNEQLDIRLNQESCVHLRYDSARHYTDVLSDIFIFVRLMTFCTYEQSYPMTIEFTREDLTDTFVEDRLKKRIPQQIQCLYHNVFYKSTYKQRKWHQHLIPFEALQGKFPNVIERWFLQSVQNSQSIEQYEFSVERFMDIAKAIEIFHRLHYPGGVMPKSEFKQWKKRFFSSSLSSEELDWLKEKLAYANEPSLKQRVQEIVRDYAFGYFEERVRDPEEFCQQVADSRNYYTHFGEHVAERALKGKALFDLTENLKLLLIAGILRNLDLPISSVDESVRRVVYG